MKRISRIAAVALLLALLPAVLLAQEEITLEYVAEAVGTVIEEMAMLTSRVDALENKLTPGSPVRDDGSCRLALQGRMSALTLVDYLEKYRDDTAPNPSYTRIAEVNSMADGSIAITFVVDASPNDRMVTEYWRGCVMVERSAWVEIDWQGNVVEE